MGDYTYSVARIRSRESGLLREQDLEQLINAKDYSEVLRILKDNGYTNDGSVIDDAMRDLWGFLDELADEWDLELLRIPNDYHNIKVSIKSKFLNINGSDLLSDYGTVDKSVVYSAVKTEAYCELPKNLGYVAEKAMLLLLRTKNPQLCDVEIDKAEQEELWDIACKSKEEFIKKYAALKIKLTNLKIASRCAAMNKDADFAKNALCDKMDDNVFMLARAAGNGKTALEEYLASNGDEEAAQVMEKSIVLFEKWCDDKLTEFVRRVRYDCVGIAPIIAYAYAKTIEIKNIRIILLAKRNKLENPGERVRELYV